MASPLLLIGFALITWALAQDPDTNTTDPSGRRLLAHSPARPPAIPLTVRSPDTNARTSTAVNGTLNTNRVIFCPGNAQYLTSASCPVTSDTCRAIGVRPSCSYLECHSTTATRQRGATGKCGWPLLARRVHDGSSWTPLRTG